MMAIYLGALGVIVVMVAVNLWRRRQDARPLISPPPREPRKPKKKRAKRGSAAPVVTTSIAQDLAAMSAALADPSVEPPPEVARMVKLMRGDPAPRGRHYAFAHVVLREAVDAPTLAALQEAARTGSLGARLRGLWDRVDAPDTGTYETVPTGRIIPHGLLVRMLEPQGSTEAHAVALMEHKGSVRYFTLEKSLLGATLCEWQGDTHVNHGSLAADEASFEAAVEQRLREGE